MWNKTPWNGRPWKPTCVVFATCLILPLLASPAVPPAAEEPAAGAARIPLTITGGRVRVELPEILRELPPEEAYLAYRSHMGRRAPVTNEAVCLAGDPSLCDFGATAAQMKPCFAAGDCPAFEVWTKVIGKPGIVPAEPSLTGAVHGPEPPDND